MLGSAGFVSGHIILVSMVRLSALVTHLKVILVGSLCAISLLSEPWLLAILSRVRVLLPGGPILILMISHVAAQREGQVLVVCVLGRHIKRI